MHDSGEQALPANVQKGEPRVPVRPAECDRGAVCGHEQHRLARAVTPEAVALFEFGRRQDALRPGLRHVRAVHLVAHRGGRRVSARLGTEPPSVLGDPVVVVVRLRAEVQRRVRTLAHPAQTGRERDPVGPRRLPLEELHPPTILIITSAERSNALWKSVKNSFWKSRMTAKSASIPYWSSAAHRA